MLIQRIIYDLLIGLIVGISMGATGIGAGLITVPLLITSGVSFKEAVSATMVMQLLPQSFLGVKNYWNEINWNLSLRIICTSVIGIFFGSKIVSDNIISELFMYKIITFFLLISSIYFYMKFW